MVTMRVVRIGCAALMFMVGCQAPDFQGRVTGELHRRTNHATEMKPNARATTWPEGIVPGRPISSEQAVALALWNNADFQLALTELGISRAEVIRVSQLPNPTFSLLFASPPKVMEFTGHLAVDSAFYAPVRRRAAKLDAEAVAERLVQGGLDLRRDVLVACAGVELARDRLRYAQESARIFEGIAKFTSAREEGGEIGGVETAQTRADALFAAQEVTRLGYEVQLAVEKVRALCGLAASREPFELRPMPLPPRRSLPGVQVLINDALASRPDLRAASLSWEAAAKRARLAPAEIFTLGAAMKATKDPVASGGERWHAQPGVDFSLPLLNQNQAGVALTDAQLQRAVRQWVAVRDRIAADVRQARERVVQARRVVAGWREVLPEMQTALDRARKTVELGEPQQFIELDAARRLAETRAKAADSDAREREAWAELERAVGGRF